jgi:hypothetical protein
MGGLFLLGSVFGIMAFLLPVALVLGLSVLLALRGEPDDGGRGVTLYLALASFVAFLTLLLAGTALAAAVTDLVAGDDESTFTLNGTSFDSSVSIGDSGSSSGFSPAPVPLRRSGQSHDDRAWTTIIQTLIAIAAAVVVLRFHWPRLESVGRRAAPGSAALRVRQAYCATVCFLVVVTLLVSSTVATFNIVQAIAPGTTGAGNRGDALESFVPVFVLAMGAAAQFGLHWRRIETPAFLRPLPPTDDAAAA